MLNNTSMWYSSNYCNPVMWGILVGGDKQPVKAQNQLVWQCTIEDGGKKTLILTTKKAMLRQ